MTARGSRGLVTTAPAIAQARAQSVKTHHETPAPGDQWSGAGNVTAPSHISVAAPIRDAVNHQPAKTKDPIGQPKNDGSI
jgi:hypothetical protein